MKKCTVFRLGQVNYDEALSFQYELLDKVKEKKRRDSYLGLLEHQPVITLGKNANKKNLLVSEETLKKKEILLRQIDRGGDVTYHGPGQVVGYPILSLAHHEKSVKDYVHTLEQCLIDTLDAFGIKAETIPKYIGVWVNGEKIGFIRLKISKGITCHGFSLNINPDMSAFKLINPCGIQDRKMTSMEKILNTKCPSLAEVVKEYIKHFNERFDFRTVQVKTHLSYIPKVL